MKDSEVTQFRKKLIPHSSKHDLVIEAVTVEKPRVDPFRSFSKSEGAGVYAQKISLPRVKWMERPDVD